VHGSRRGASERPLIKNWRRVRPSQQRQCSQYKDALLCSFPKFSEQTGLRAVAISSQAHRSSDNLSAL
jgi:hypothetical protein